MRRETPGGKTVDLAELPVVRKAVLGCLCLGRSVQRRRSDRRGQAPKGAGGMPRRHQIRAWKAAISPGELPNEHRSRNPRATQGTETSQYLVEEKSTETPLVAASERGPAQTGRDTARGCGAGVTGWIKPSRSPLENGTRAGDSPVGCWRSSYPVPK